MFVSSHENLVFDAIDYMPLGFVRKGRLEKDMAHAVSLYFRATAFRRISYKIKDGFSCRELLLRDILYIECTGHEVFFVMAEGNGRYRTHGSLRAIEAELASYGFLRVHKNYLVNQKYVKDVEKREILLADGQRVDMGKERRKAVKEAMLCYGRKHGGIKRIFD